MRTLPHQPHSQRFGTEQQGTWPHNDGRTDGDVSSHPAVGEPLQGRDRTAHTGAGVRAPTPGGSHASLRVRTQQAPHPDATPGTGRGTVPLHRSDAQLPRGV